MAFAARSCERRANASWSARAMPNSAATLSAVSGIESVPNFSRMAGLTNRQPMVVSWISVDRENADAALGMTNGARLMLSTPPASTRSASPERTARDAMAIASRLDPQSRFTVPPGAATGRSGQQRRHPGDVAVVLAGLVGAAEQHVVQLRPSRPTAAARPGPRSTWAARSSGRTVASAPPYRPNGVRTPATR